MFRRRLTFSLGLLAAAVLVQGLGAVAALGVARQQVERGRVASDIHTAFVMLAATKQRLRTWVAQRQQGADADPAVRETLQADMRSTLQRLQSLSESAVALDDSAASQGDHLQRMDAVKVLGRSLTDLEQTVDAAAPLEPGADARQAWQALSAVFEQSQGRDLRRLIDDSLARETAAQQRERSAADHSLARLRSIWLGMAFTLALLAMAAAWHFARALRRPLDLLSEGALALQHGQLQHRVPLRGADEFSAVAQSMNSLADELAQHRAREEQARQQLEDQVSLRTSELRAALDALHAADARRRQLFADISHELRTPTTAIRGEAEVTLRGGDRPADDYRQTLKRIVATSGQLASVIDDLLAMARSDIDALSLVRQAIDLADPLAEALAQAQALAAQRGIVLQAPGCAGPCLVLGDAQRLRQVLLILLDNAVRYSRTGGRVSVTLQAGPGDGGSSWEVRVDDCGIGIADDDLPRVFERQFRGRDARRHRPDGSGLGLTIAQALARAHRGRIVLHSQPGRGTTASLLLPALAGADPQPPEARHRSPPESVADAPAHAPHPDSR